MNKLSLSWHELKRRKVIPFLIGYVAACFAIIEFLDISSTRFTIPDKTFDLLYILGAIGLPVVIILPWIIYKNKGANEDAVSVQINESTKEKVKKAKHNLPSQLTTFIGREKETKVLRELIGEHRITTVSGSGGCGKTRLACEAAATLIQDFKDGVWFVDLAPIVSEELVAKEITEVLKINEEPGRTITETLSNRIKNKNLLIILDNCEHLISACSEVSWNLIQSVPGLKILTTSREPLNLNGEKVWRIPSLTLLDPKTIINLESAKSSEAVQLFTNRALLNNPEFELVTENVQEVVTICNKLDGIPLALELVASRTRHMKPQMMLERLADNFELLSSSDLQTSSRQKTLHATIEWGYNLLSENEKLLFTRLSVFTGGFNLPAIEAVCVDEKLPLELILDLLSSLVDKSLIITVSDAGQSMKYSFYETIRQFSLQKLQSLKMEDHLREKHLHYYLNLAEKANKERLVSESKWLNTIEQEHDNMMAALQWSEGHTADDFVSLAGYLAWFWSWHGHFFMGGNYLEKAKVKGTKQTEAYARVLGGAGMISFFTGDPEKGFAFLKESQDIWRLVENYEEEALNLINLSMSNQTIGNVKSGMLYAKEGLAIAQQVGNPGIINGCLAAVCQGLITEKKVDETRSTAQQLMVSTKELNQPSMLRLAYHFTADCDLMEGKYQEAEKGYGTALEVAYKTGNMFFVCIELLGVAFTVAAQSRLAKAIHLSTVSREYCSQNGIMIPEELQLSFWLEFVDTYIKNTKTKLGEELTRKYEEEAKSMEIEEAIEYALDFRRD